jgi:thiol-disulfide isomerase/thioredoxin
MKTLNLAIFIFLMLGFTLSCATQRNKQQVKLDHTMNPRPNAIYHNYAEWLGDNPKKAKKYILRAGYVSLKGEKFQIIARDINNNGRFDDEGIDAIGVAGEKSKEECAFETSCSNIILYSKNLNIKVDGSYYTIESINPNGDIVQVTTLESAPSKLDLTFYQTLPFFLKLKMIENDQEKPLRELINPNAKYIYLSFWSTYCSPCIEEIPLINEFVDKGFAIVNICESKMYKSATKYIKQYNFKGEHVYANPTIEKDLQLNTNGFPNGILFDRQGNILSYNIRIYDVQKFIDKL